MQQVDKASGKNRTVLLKRHGQPHGLQVPTRGAPNPAVTALQGLSPCMALLSSKCRATRSLYSHPGGPWASSPCDQGSLVLLEHLCLTILPPAGLCQGFGGMAWCRSCSAPLQGVGRAVRLSLPFPQVMHPALRPAAPNPCVARGCSHLCLLSARHAGQCRCPTGLTLAADETTCLPLRDSAFALLVSPAAVAQVLSSAASPGGC